MKQIIANLGVCMLAGMMTYLGEDTGSLGMNIISDVYNNRKNIAITEIFRRFWVRNKENGNELDKLIWRSYHLAITDICEVCKSNNSNNKMVISWLNERKSNSKRDLNEMLKGNACYYPIESTIEMVLLTSNSDNDELKALEKKLINYEVNRQGVPECYVREVKYSLKSRISEIFEKGVYSNPKANAIFATKLQLINYSNVSKMQTYNQNFIESKEVLKWENNYMYHNAYNLSIYISLIFIEILIKQIKSNTIIHANQLLKELNLDYTLDENKIMSLINTNEINEIWNMEYEIIDKIVDSFGENTNMEYEGKIFTLGIFIQHTGVQLCSYAIMKNDKIWKGYITQQIEDNYNSLEGILKAIKLPIEINSEFKSFPDLKKWIEMNEDKINEGNISGYMINELNTYNNRILSILK